MTPEEIEAKRLADEQLAKEMEQDELVKIKEKLAKAEEDRDNYKNVALKRLGKLPGDAEFLNKGDEAELSVEERVRLALLDNEVEKTRESEKAEVERIRRENAELRLALKNRPGSGVGGGSGDEPGVKDNVFSASQLDALRAKAKRLNADPEQFIQKAKENLHKRS